MLSISVGSPVVLVLLVLLSLFDIASLGVYFLLFSCFCKQVTLFVTEVSVLVAFVVWFGVWLYINRGGLALFVWILLPYGWTVSGPKQDRTVSQSMDAYIPNIGTYGVRDITSTYVFVSSI